MTKQPNGLTHFLTRFLPIMSWAKDYNSQKLSADVVAAIIVTILLIPQSLAYAMIAGLPAEAGLYASILPLVAYGVFGSSRVLAVGPVAIVSLMTAATVAKLNLPTVEMMWAAASLLAIMSGIFLVALGLLRLGVLSHFISHSVTSVFITASAIIIAVGQLKHLLGIPIKGDNLFEQLHSLFMGLNQFHLQTFILGSMALIAISAMKIGLKPLLIKLGLSESAANITAKMGPVLVVIITTLSAYLLDLGGQGVALVGDIPASLPPLSLPHISYELVSELFIPAMLISVIGFVESMSVANTLAAKKRQKVDANNELIGLGTANLLSGINRGFPVTGVGAEFSFETMRMEMTDFVAVIFNPDAQAKFVHTVSAGYTAAAMFVLSISAWYLLRGKNVEFAKRSFHVAAAFGLAGVLSVIVLGDESGYTVGEAQQTKMAALEAMWHTEPAPASFNLIAGINEAEQKNDWAVEIPYVMGLIGTRSLDKEIPGIHDIKERNRERIQTGIVAVGLLEQLREDPKNAELQAQFKEVKDDLGFGLLLKAYTDDVSKATPEMIQLAVDDTVPAVTPMFWSFRLMVGLGFAMLLVFGLAFYFSLKGQYVEKRKFLWLCLLALPAPWIAIEAGWFVAEYGRQPWTIYGVLPTHLSVSTISKNSIIGSMAGFIFFYTFLLIIEMYLMIKYVKLGPESLGTGRYEGEKKIDTFTAPTNA